MCRCLVHVSSRDLRVQLVSECRRCGVAALDLATLKTRDLAESLNFALLTLPASAAFERLMTARSRPLPLLALPPVVLDDATSRMVERFVLQNLTPRSLGPLSVNGDVLLIHGQPLRVRLQLVEAVRMLLGAHPRTLEYDAALATLPRGHANREIIHRLMKELRAALGEYGAMVVTVHGVGYRLEWPITERAKSGEHRVTASGLRRVIRTTERGTEIGEKLENSTLADLKRTRSHAK